MESNAERRRFLAHLASVSLVSALPRATLTAQGAAQSPQAVTREMVAAAARVAGDALTDAEVDTIVERVNQTLPTYQQLRALTLDNGLAPPLHFNPGIARHADRPDCPAGALAAAAPRGPAGQRRGAGVPAGRASRRADFAPGA